MLILDIYKSCEWIQSGFQIFQNWILQVMSLFIHIFTSRNSIPLYKELSFLASKYRIIKIVYPEND